MPEPRKPRSGGAVTGNTVPGGGATQAKTSFGDRLISWLRHHRASYGHAWNGLMGAKAQALMTLMVLAIALGLPVILLLTLENVASLSERWSAQPKITVYLNGLAKPAAIDQLQRQYQASPEVEQVTYISPEQALTSFQADANMADVLEALDDNPLPPTLVITPSLTGMDEAQLASFVQTLRESRLVEAVDWDMAWIRKLQLIMALAQTIVSGLAGLLTLGVLLVIGNTIRLAIESRREEIIVTKLVGGSDAFVRRPFLYLGLVYGLGAAFLAALAISFAVLGLSAPISELSRAYGSDFTLQGLGFDGVFTLLVAGCLIGWVGAWLSVGRHLSAIEPS